MSDEAYMTNIRRGALTSPQPNYCNYSRIRGFEMTSKPKIAFFSLTSCEGCQFVLLDLGEKFFKFLKKTDLIDFSLVEEKKFPKGKIKIDVAFVEGNPITKEDVALLKKIRKESKVLAALGNCAALGGIPEMKNYQNKERTIRHIYKNLKKVANPEIREIDNFVKVDFVIPGCPINGDEFLKLARVLIAGKIPEIVQTPVCSECSYRATKNCFLVRKEICFGPITLAGCQAICTKNESACLACRGFLKSVSNVGVFVDNLKKNKGREEVEDAMEIFGLRDEKISFQTKR